MDVKPLDSDNDYTRIAEYFIKYSKKTEDATGKVGRRWNPSRNLKKPVVIKKIVNANTFADKARKSTIRKYDNKGYYLVAGSEVSGISELGFKYYEVKFRKGKRDAEGKRIHKDDS